MWSNKGLRWSLGIIGSVLAPRRSLQQQCIGRFATMSSGSMGVRFNHSGRKFPQIQRSLSQGILDFRKPADYLINIIYCIPVLATIRFCIETGLFERLKEAQEVDKGDLSAEVLAESLPWNTTSGIDRGAAVPQRREYVIRMLRPVIAMGLIDEGQEAFTYRGNALTREIADPGMASGFLLMFDDLMGPKSAVSSLLSYSKETSFCAPPTAKDGPYQRARDIVGTSTFDHWNQREPQQLSRLSTFMTRVQSDRPHWTAWFPRDRLLSSGTSSKRVFMVDVGGGFGHDLFALATKYSDPDLRFVLQDQAPVIEEGQVQRSANGSELDSRIALSSSNFFSPQPIREASIYFMHKIMHDWPDADCVRILTHLRDAMAPDSRIFINDVIVPDRNATMLQAAFDISMLTLLSGQERDEEMWRRLVAAVDGLEIVAFHHPPGGEGEGIVEVAVASGFSSRKDQ